MAPEKLRIYRAIPVGDHDGRGNPLVRIFDDTDPGANYFASVLKSTGSVHSEERNDVRQKILEGTKKGQFDWCYVMVTGLPGGIPDRCSAVGCSDKAAKNGRYGISREEAFGVIRAQNVHYARAMFRSDDEYNGFAMRAWADLPEEAERRFGFFAPPRNGNLAQKLITIELLKGSGKKRKLELGDRLIVERVSKCRGSQQGEPIYFFAPATCFRESDNVHSPSGDTLVTVVEGYKPGCSIHNLPLPTLGRGREPDDWFAMGYVDRPESEKKRFELKPVLVKGAEDCVGKFVPKARILYANNIILAERLE